MSDVDKILNLGDDALTNSFELFFPDGIPGGGTGEVVALRMDQSFDIPETGVGQYDIFYRGLKISKTNKLEETDKNVTMDVRLDQQWEVYDELNAWLKLSFDPETSTSATEAETRTTIGVRALDGGNNIVKTLLLRNSKLRALKIATFDHNTSDPIRLTLSFIYGNVEEA